MKNANARVHIGEAPYHRMEMSNMKHNETSEIEKLKIIYGTDEKGRLYTKNQLGGEVLAIHRWKSIQHYVDDKPPAKITEHSHDIGSMNVSSGNSHHTEPMVGIVWSSEPPLLTPKQGEDLHNWVTSRVTSCSGYGGVWPTNWGEMFEDSQS